MNIKQWLKSDYLPFLLITLMVMTRFHHFGDVLHLPDATLAIFFFAGFYRKKALLGFLLIMAGLIDYIAIKNGTSDYCVSAAYMFLIPTYATMWLAGRYCATFKALQVSELVKSIGLLMLATTTAFVISNASFYMLSGKFDALSLLEYVARVQQYYLPYVASTLFYGMAGFAALKLIKLLPESLSSHKSV
jgi:hypothetical protein